MKFPPDHELRSVGTAEGVFCLRILRSGLIDGAWSVLRARGYEPGVEPGPDRETCARAAVERVLVWWSGAYDGAGNELRFDAASPASVVEALSLRVVELLLLVAGSGELRGVHVDLAECIAVNGPPPRVPWPPKTWRPQP